MSTHTGSVLQDLADLHALADQLSAAHANGAVADPYILAVIRQASGELNGVAAAIASVPGLQAEMRAIFQEHDDE